MPDGALILWVLLTLEKMHGYPNRPNFCVEYRKMNELGLDTGETRALHEGFELTRFFCFPSNFPFPDAL